MIGRIQNSRQAYKTYSQQTNHKNKPAFSSRFEKMENLTPELIKLHGKDSAKEIVTRLAAKAAELLEDGERFVFRSVAGNSGKYLCDDNISFSIHEEQPATWIGKLFGFGERPISNYAVFIFNPSEPEESLDKLLQKAREKRNEKYSPKVAPQKADIEEINAIWRGEAPKELPPPPKMLPDPNNPYRGTPTEER